MWRTPDAGGGDEQKEYRPKRGHGSAKEGRDDETVPSLAPSSSVQPFILDPCRSGSFPVNRTLTVREADPFSSLERKFFSHPSMPSSERFPKLVVGGTGKNRATRNFQFRDVSISGTRSR